MSDLDILLRLRLKYDDRGGREAVRDLEEFRRTLRQLDGLKVGNNLEASLKAVGTAAGASEQDLKDLRTAAGLLDRQSLDRLESDLVALGSASDKSRAGVLYLNRSIDNLSREQLDDLEADLKLLGTAAGGSKGDVDKLRKEAEGLGNTQLEKLIGDLKQLGDVASTQKAEIDLLRQSLERLRNAGPSGRYGPRRTTGAGGRFRQDALSEAAQQAGIDPTFIGIGGRGALIGAGIGATALAAGTGTYWTAKEAVDFERSYVGVRKAIDTDEEGHQQIQRDILAASRAMGTDPNAIARMVAALGFAGYSADEAVDAARHQLKTASAFELSPEQTAQDLSTIRNSYKITNDQLKYLTDSINLLADKGSSSETGILEFLNRLNATGDRLSIDPNFVAAIAATFGDVGVGSERGATALDATLLRLVTATQQPAGFQDGLKKIGVGAADLEKRIAADGAGGLLYFLERLEQLSVLDQGKALEAIVGVEHSGKIGSLVANLDILREHIDRLGDPDARAASSVDQTAQLFQDSTQAALDRLTQTMTSLGIKIGDRLAPAIERLANWLAGVFGSWIDDMEAAEDRRAAAAKASDATAADLTPAQRAATAENPLEMANTFAGRANDLAQARDRLALIDERLGRTGQSPSAVKQLKELRAEAMSELNDLLLGNVDRDDPAAIAAFRERLETIQKLLPRTGDELVGGAPVDGQLSGRSLEFLQRQIEALKALEDSLNGLQDHSALEFGLFDKLASLKPLNLKETLGIDLTSAAGDAMDGYLFTLGNELATAENMAAQSAARMKQLLSFTAQPTIVPAVAPGASSSAAVAAARNAPQSTPTNSAEHRLTVNQRINGAGDPYRIAKRIARQERQAIERSKSGALGDTVLVG